MPAQKPAQAVPKALNDIGGLNGIKDFVADLVFSDDTMVGDVTVNKKGETMRKILTSDRNVIALAEIIKDPTLIDRACAPEIADAVKDGLGKMVDILDAEFKKANGGKSLAVAATEEDFAQNLSLFLKDPAKLLGTELAKFDNLILAMANKGCENIQQFINTVFQVGNANANAQGSIVNEPYKNTSAKDLKTQLDGKNLNQILDSAANADAPGQIGFFRQIISTYFTSLGKADKRSCFAAAMRYAKTFDFTGLQGEKLVSAQQAAINKFTGAILKGTSPLLQKMMQGLPKDIMGKYADALDDMKSNLAPIPRKVVQAHFMKMINESKGKGPGKEIESIELKQSLGAASVGEAFLCAFKIKGEKEPRQLVVKIMRHDAERRVESESKIFTAAAEAIGPGMATTWKGQLAQYMTEFDFRTEANNAKEGVKLYDIAPKAGEANANPHPLFAIAPHVKSMKISDIVAPTKDVMVAEVADGKPMDKYFKEQIADIRKTASAVFEEDSATGQIKWEDGPIDPKTNKPKKVPVLKKDLPVTAIPHVIDTCFDQCKKIGEAQGKLIEATKAWFHEALLGSGKFHGDTHAGNLMVDGSNITFIDFGNLYELKSARPLLDKNGNAVIDKKTNQPVMVNERHELLRVIMGATFRDKSFVLRGLENLLSPAGKAALEANRDKVEAVLDSILAKGKFSYDVVYRLNAVVSELQKLGLELPPQINCFVQSMARLANTISEMNTIINQTRALIDTVDGYVRPGPAPQRDELDLLGIALDFRTSAEGQVRVDDDNETLSYHHPDGTPFQISAFLHHLGTEGFGGFSFEDAPFQTNGAYYNKVLARLTNAQDPAEEARKLTDMFAASADLEHNKANKSYVLTLNEAVEKIKNAKTDVEKTAAVKSFALQYGSIINSICMAMQATEGVVVELRELEEAGKIQPKSFASALMGILTDNFDALSNTFADSTGRLLVDVKSISMNELGLGLFSGQQATIDAIKKDARDMPGENSYQVDIGV